jgi:hypothetical protein
MTILTTPWPNAANKKKSCLKRNNYCNKKVDLLAIFGLKVKYNMAININGIRKERETHHIPKACIKAAGWKR